MCYHTRRQFAMVWNKLFSCLVISSDSKVTNLRHLGTALLIVVLRMPYRQNIPSRRYLILRFAAVRACKISGRSLRRILAGSNKNTGTRDLHPGSMFDFAAIPPLPNATSAFLRRIAPQLHERAMKELTSSNIGSLRHARSSLLLPSSYLDFYRGALAP